MFIRESIQTLQAKYDSISKEQTNDRKLSQELSLELAYAEVTSYNKKNLARELQNESRQHNRQQNKTKRRKKFNVNFIVKTGVFFV